MKKALLLAAAFAALAPTTANADRPCLQYGWIYNWKAISDKTLMVEDYHHRKFRLSMIGMCNNLQFHEALQFKSRGALSLSCLQPGDEVISRDFGIGPSRCAITRIEYYTPEMEQADRAAMHAARDRRGGY